MRPRMLLAAGAVSLGLLGSCLSMAQASTSSVPVSEVTAQAVQEPAPVADASVPLPEDLDEASQELDDLISLPVREALGRFLRII